MTVFGVETLLVNELGAHLTSVVRKLYVTGRNLRTGETVGEQHGQADGLSGGGGGHDEDAANVEGTVRVTTPAVSGGMNQFGCPA